MRSMEGAQRLRAAAVRVGVLGAVTAGVLWTSPAALADTWTDQPMTVTLAPGATGAVPMTVKVTSATATFYPPGSIVMTAPGNTTFAPGQTTVPTNYSTNGGASYVPGAVTVNNCVYGSGNTRLTCTVTPVAGISVPVNTLINYVPQVTVNASAPTGTVLPPGSATFNYTGSGSSNQSVTGSLNVKTTGTATVPVGTVGGAAAAAIAGVGAVWFLRRRNRAGTAV
ncbi:MAG TPA: hypothetical protein VN969_43275 [Streptosporangiaceae bacterium]|nr:hypothetical protein [Streptosporangiaceae bacterium]